MHLLETGHYYSGPKLLSQEAPQYCVIWLHGLGASHGDFIDLMPYLKLDESKAVHFIFPQAPDRAITANNYMRMPAWYDIGGWDFETNARDADREGMQISIKQIHQLIAQQIEKGIAPEQIMIGGFSQGGVIGLLSALAYPGVLAGAFGLSCYLPDLSAFNFSRPLKTPNIFMAHGQRDNLVPYSRGEAAKQQLALEWGANIEWHSYAIEHTINLEESKTLGHWMNRQFK